MLNSKILVPIVLLLIALSLWFAPNVDEEPNEQDPQPTQQIHALVALPYVGLAPAHHENEGVTRHDRARSYAGLNIHTYTHNTSVEAYLRDMDGKVVHKWKANTEAGFGHVELGPRGSLYVQLFSPRLGDTGLMKLSWNSKIEWKTDGQFHHDIDVLENGEVYALDKAEVPIRLPDGRQVIAEDNFIARLDKKWQRETARLALLIVQGPHASDLVRSLGGISREPTIGTEPTRTLPRYCRGPHSCQYRRSVEARRSANWEEGGRVDL